MDVGTDEERGLFRYMLEELKERVYKANMELPEKGLVLYTWGNVSGIDRSNGLIVIKPSGVEYEKLKVSDMVVVDLDGKVVEGELNPSSDTATHIELYKAFSEIGGIVHTHSSWATIWSQSGKDLKAYGTTHADYYYGSIPCTRGLTKEEIEGEYEKETGKVIIETFKNRGIKAGEVSGVLVKSHGPFTWGKSPEDAVYNSVVLEEIAKTGAYTELLNKEADSMDQNLLDKHFLRKHGKNAYYGQKK